jgi:hypothetical protein
MKVKDLINQLSELDHELEIFMSSDAEGNRIQPIPDNCISELSIYQKDGRHVDVWSVNWTAEEACFSKEKWEEMKRTYPMCVILYP